MPKRYTIAIRRNDNIGTEEYDGGTTIADARKEAAFFVANTASHVNVRICRADARGLRTIEYARLDGRVWPSIVK